MGFSLAFWNMILVGSAYHHKRENPRNRILPKLL